MIKSKFMIAVAAVALLVACNPSAKKADQSQEAETEQVQIVETTTSKLTGADGTELEMSFDNEKGTATVIFNGETIEMTSQRPASGIWYKNDHYELSGNGEETKLLKDGKEVFVHKGEKTIVKDFKGKDGKEMTVNIYNETNTATVVFEGETIDLEGQKPASGIWYKNDHYELSGKGDAVELLKDGKVVFSSL